ncbi:hypothetical protein CHS0354_003506 [Potamilus streckersoni]|uniref:Uncharacterized protein n=1 Tax=Potamilus streckersoni TaxID=2493646 RepID=A0AAE0W4B1_9BIVA|nr:hypothetical protein CHS0354_003506 [Potamilus streckersoni]
MATAIINSDSKDRQKCPICLDVFTLPRQLPCLHSFCEHCLQDYITKKASSTGKALDQFMCPVSRAVTRPVNKEQPSGEWASLFPHSPFPLMGKSVVERSCEVCKNKSDSSTYVATKVCVICEEFMCDNCAVCHQNMKIGKNHRMITTDEWESNPKIRLKFTRGFGCPEHGDEDIKYYCMVHETALCGTCLFHHHKACHAELELKQSSSTPEEDEFTENDRTNAQI